MNWTPIPLSVSNYPDMLKKLHRCNFIVVALCLYLMKSRIPAISNALKNIDVLSSQSPTVVGLTVGFGVVFVSVLISLVFASLKLHDKISNIFKIRYEFDISKILIPSALLSGAHVDVGRFERIRLTRDTLMGRVFYDYASSSAGRAVIDSHTITQALTCWSWYWLCVETTATLGITAFIFIIFSQADIVVTILVAILLLLLLMRFFYLECTRYAEAQVRQILSDPARRTTIAGIFNAV